MSDELMCSQNSDDLFQSPPINERNDSVRQSESPDRRSPNISIAPNIFTASFNEMFSCHDETMKNLDSQSIHSQDNLFSSPENNDFLSQQTKDNNQTLQKSNFFDESTPKSHNLFAPSEEDGIIPETNVTELDSSCEFIINDSTFVRTSERQISGRVHSKFSPETAQHHFQANLDQFEANVLYKTLVTDLEIAASQDMFETPMSKFDSGSENCATNIVKAINELNADLEKCISLPSITSTINSYNKSNVNRNTLNASEICDGVLQLSTESLDMAENILKPSKTINNLDPYEITLQNDQLNVSISSQNGISDKISIDLSFDLGNCETANDRKFLQNCTSYELSVDRSKKSSNSRKIGARDAKTTKCDTDLSSESEEDSQELISSEDQSTAIGSVQSIHSDDSSSHESDLERNSQPIVNSTNYLKYNRTCDLEDEISIREEDEDHLMMYYTTLLKSFCEFDDSTVVQSTDDTEIVPEETEYEDEICEEFVNEFDLLSNAPELQKDFIFTSDTIKKFENYFVCKSEMTRVRHITRPLLELSVRSYIYFRIIELLSLDVKLVNNRQKVTALGCYRGGKDRHFIYDPNLNVYVRILIYKGTVPFKGYDIFLFGNLVVFKKTVALQVHFWKRVGAALKFQDEMLYRQRTQQLYEHMCSLEMPKNNNANKIKTIDTLSNKCTRNSSNANYIKTPDTFCNKYSPDKQKNSINANEIKTIDAFSKECSPDKQKNSINATKIHISDSNTDKISPNLLLEYNPIDNVANVAAPSAECMNMKSAKQNLSKKFENECHISKDVQNFLTSADETFMSNNSSDDYNISEESSDRTVSDLLLDDDRHEISNNCKFGINECKFLCTSSQLSDDES